MNSQRSREGYLMIDHRASPGLDEGLARYVGLDPTLAGEGKLLEAATLTCSHCKAVVVKNPLRVRERAQCAKCGWHYVCDFCFTEMQAADYSHLPFEGLVDLEQRFASQKGLKQFQGTPQELLRHRASGTVPQLNPRDNS